MVDRPPSDRLSDQLVTLLRFPVAGNPALTKRQLAAHLGRSIRWVELRTAEGMPSIDPTRRNPSRRYPLRDVEEWLQRNGKLQR